MENTGNMGDTGCVATFQNGAAAGVAPPALDELKKEEGRRGGWYTKLVVRYLKRNVADRAAREARGVVTSTESPHVRARNAIRAASIKSAIAGALCGAVSTAATVFTAETEGLGGIVAGPVAALAIGGEMILRTICHVGLTCELAEIFDVEIDPDDDDDLWRLYALAFNTHGHDGESDDPGKDLVSEVTHLEGEAVGEKLGAQVLGESVVRNIIPVLGIVTSAWTNYRMTRRLGDTVRRYMRYQHALGAESAHAAAICRHELDLVLEGIWFIFSADGKLTPEEAAFLAHMLKKLDPLRRKAVLARFVEDELDWTLRIHTEVPEHLRDTFLHTLEVAAAVDKEVSLPERKILSRAAHALGREFKRENVEKMIAELEETGVLSHPACEDVAAAAADA
jgi:hypothetical protein